MYEHRTLTIEMADAQDESIREVVEENGKRLFDFIRQRVNKTEEAEDIFQDVLFELTASYRMMQPIEKMAAWLFKVARNKIIDTYRKKKTLLLDDQLIYQGSGEDDQLYLADLIRGSAESPDAEFDQDLIWNAIEQALEGLPKEQREVFMKHELEGISYKQMAKETGESVNTLLSRKRYAILALRKSLQNLYDEMY